MIKPAALALLLAPLALAACSSEPAETAPATGDEPPSSAPSTADTAPVEEGIPQAMLGVWDYVGGSCDPASDLRLEIAADQLLFYESVGTVQSVSREGDDVTITLAMEGEGETWEDSLTYRLAEGGTILESDLPDPMGNGLLQRTRCEG